MRDWSPERLAAAAGAALAAAPLRHERSGPPGPLRVTIDSRDVRPGDLFVGLPGTRTDGGRFASSALHAGAWGVIVAPEHVSDARCGPVGVVVCRRRPARRAAVAGPRVAARARRAVLAITGSTGKTSTKDLLAAMLAQDRRVVASEQNLNTEIGLPLTILGAPYGTDALVLEMAMRGSGQIAELAEIAEPDVGVIVNVGPVHLELLGTRRGRRRRESRAALRAASGRDDRAARIRAAAGPLIAVSICAS